MNRVATPADLETVIRFNREYAKFSNYPIDQEKLQEAVTRTLEGWEKAFYLLAIRADRPLGQIRVRRDFHDLRGREMWQIQHAWVVPERRGQGVVADLVSTARLLGVEQHAVNLNLLVDHDNTSARRAYEEKAGFKRLPLDVMVLEL
jgi:ribosomal protein S18 acetylase RimI-like enzyme